jgi:phosphate transport system substrate-binding protein
MINVVFRSDESAPRTASRSTSTRHPTAHGARLRQDLQRRRRRRPKGNEGTSAAIKSTAGSITYNEWSYATKQGLQIADVITSAGPDPVKLTAESAGKSIDSVKIKGQGNDLVLDTSSFYKPTAAGAYPIILGTYNVVCSKYPQSDVAPRSRRS